MPTYNLGSSNSPVFKLTGGRYAVKALGTFGGGSIDLKGRGPDNVTYQSVLTAPFTVSGVALADLPGGLYQFVVTTATSCYASVEPIRATLL